jgi:hypothetical protein
MPELWHAATEGHPLRRLTADNEARDWLVWRKGLAVYYRPLENGEAQALEAAAQGATFAGWCEGLSHRLEDTLGAAGAAASLLRRWLDDNLIVGAVSGPESLGVVPGR